LLQISGAWDAFLNQHKDAKRDITQYIKSFKTEDGVFSEERGTASVEGDVTSTYFGVATAKALGSLTDVGVSGGSAGEWIVSLQAPNGGFRLRKSSNSGHYVNTYYALQALEALNKTNLLETTYSRPGGVVLQGVQFIPTIAIWIVIVLVLVASCLILWLMSPSISDEVKEKAEEEEKEGDESKDKEETKGKDNEKSDKEKPRLKKRSKKEPTITLYRDKKTQQCVDTDGEPFPVDSLNRKEWDIISKEEKDTHTVFVIRKKDSKSDSGRGSRGRKRNK